MKRLDDGGRFALAVGLGFLGLMMGTDRLAAQTPPDVAARMQGVVKRFVEQTGRSVVGLGSWITGKNFNPATSDFDLRLLAPRGTPSEQQLQMWSNAQQTLREMIRREFGEQTEAILRRTNFYPPNGLMQGTMDAEDALLRFRQYNTVPCLGHVGPVTERTPLGRLAEGLYGEGSQAYHQAYEQAAGRLFYNNGGRCAVGFTDLTHLEEGVHRYTAAGTANTAGQWAEHALRELQAGQGARVAKYLERLERDLIKSRDLSRLPIDDAFRSELRAMQETLKKSPGRLGEISDDLARLLGRAGAEAAILRNYEGAGPLRRAYLRVMLDSVAAKNKVGQLLQQVMEKVPSAVDAENTMMFIAFCMGTGAAAQSIGAGENMLETLNKFSGAVNPLKIIGPLKLIGPALLTELTTQILLEARASGLEAAAGAQEAWDLMNGIYSAWGRADVETDPRFSRPCTLDDLVTGFQDEDKLQAFVYWRCQRAATRGFGEAGAELDEALAEQIFAKCWPVIRDAWRWQRDALATEYLTLASQVVHAPLLLYYQPVEPKTGEAIALEARSYDGKLGEKLERLNQIIKLLYGRSSFIAVHYYWTPAGESEAGRGWRQTLTFNEPGKYPVKVRLELTPQTPFPKDKVEPRIMLPRTLEAVAEVEVSGEKKGAGNEIQLSFVENWIEILVTMLPGNTYIETNARVSLSGLLRGGNPQLHSDWGRARVNERVRAIFAPRYSVAAGTPCHLELQCDASIGGGETKWKTNDIFNGQDEGTATLSLKSSRLEFRIYYTPPGGVGLQEKTSPGPRYTLDYVPRRGEEYRVTAVLVVEGMLRLTGTLTPPGGAPQYYDSTEAKTYEIALGDVWVITP